MINDQASQLIRHWLIFRFAASIAWAAVITWGLQEFMNEDVQFFWVYLIVFVALPTIAWAMNWANTYIGHEAFFGRRLEDLVFNQLTDQKMPVMTGPFEGWTWEEYLTAVVDWPGSTKQHCMMAAATFAEDVCTRNASRLLARLNSKSLNAAVNRYIRVNQDRIDSDFDEWLTENDEMALLRSRYRGL